MVGTRTVRGALRGYPLGQMHEGRFQVDFVFLETAQPKAGLNEDRGEFAEVFRPFGQCGQDSPILELTAILMTDSNFDAKRF